jgi:hypothetical protein
MEIVPVETSGDVGCSEISAVPVLIVSLCSQLPINILLQAVHVGLALLHAGI